MSNPLAIPKIRHAVELVLICCALILASSFILEWWSEYQMESDEGFNLQKAILLAEGHRLYQDIWSDQPPFLTILLAAVHKLFPYSIFAARSVILLFSCILAVSLFQIVNRFEGRLSAWIAITLLLLSKFYLELSVSVLIGLPAIALAVLALNLATIKHSHSQAIRLVLAGVFFACAIMTKMFVLMILPAFLVVFWLPAENGGARRISEITVATAWFVSSLVLTLLLYFVIFDPTFVQQLTEPHVSARGNHYVSLLNGIWILLVFIRKSILVPAFFALIFGVPAFFSAWRSSLAVPFIWLVTALIVFAMHAPLQSHHMLMLMVPMCWLGGSGFGRFLRSPESMDFTRYIFPRADPRLAKVIWSLIIIGIVGVIWKELDSINKRSRLQSAKALEQMAELRLRIFDNGGESIVTDKPIDAYYLRKGVPPPLAVWSAKRLATGNVTSADILREIDNPKTDQIYSRRFTGMVNNEIAPAIISDGEFSDVTLSTDHFLPMRTRHFARVATKEEIEVDLLTGLPDIVSETLGGLDAPNQSARIEEKSSTAPMPAGSIVSSPPDSAQELGMCLLAASEITDSKRLLAESAQIARALACTQRGNGGWISFDVPRKRCREKTDRNVPATLDDGTLSSIMYFAFDLSDRLDEISLGQQAWLDQMIEKGLSFAANSQKSDGGWPLSTRKDDYHGLSTINDDVTTGMIRLLVRAFQRTGNEDYLASAIRGGDYLLRAQEAGNDAAFAQQYSDELKPAPARAFEPAAFSSRETAYAINALIDLYLETGDSRYKESSFRAADWLVASQLAPDRWARFYDLEENRPVYATRSGEIFGDVEKLPEDERDSYDWIGGFDAFPDIGIALERVSLLRENPDLLRKYDQDLAGSALFSVVPPARIYLRTEYAQQFAENPSNSARNYAKYCAGLIAMEMTEPK